MSWDQIIDYSETDLKPSKQPIESEKRVIVTKKSSPTPEYLTPFFDRDKFDFNIMFTQKPVRENNFRDEYNKVHVNRNTSQIRVIDRNRNNQIQEQAQDEERSSSKSESNWGVSQPILKDIHMEEQQQKQQEQKEKQESVWVDQKQIEAQDPKEEEQKNQASQIENFSEQFLNAKTMLLLSSEAKNEDQFTHQGMERQNQKIIPTENILQISQIIQKMDKKEQDSGIQQMSETQRNLINEKLKQQDFKSLKYHIKTENCETIKLKYIIDPFGSPVKIKQLRSNDYLKVQKNKVTIPSSAHDNFIWEVGQSKREIVPAILSIYCRSCRQLNKRCEIETSTQFCSTICQNQKCTKNIIFEITQIVLQ